MRMAYLILAHGDEAQLDLLCERLVPTGSPDVAIIHCDARSPLWPRLRARAADPTGRVQILPDPVGVRWGHWSMVEAMRRLIAAALAQDCDYAHLLSGAGWPVVPRDAIARELAAIAPLPCHIEAVPGLDEMRMQTFRFDQRWLRVDPGRNKRAYAATWQLRRLSRWSDAMRQRTGRERSRPWGPWCKGSQWWSLPRDVLETVASGLDRLSAANRLSGTVCADEHVIQTIVAAEFPGRLAPNKRYIDFPEGDSSPRILTRADLPAIKASSAWFMRKVALGVDDFFLDLPEGSGAQDSALRAAG